jgi:hypothetical protein
MACGVAFAVELVREREFDDVTLRTSPAGTSK